MRELKLTVLFMLFLLPCSAYGQYSKLASPNDFSDESVRIDFEGYWTDAVAADLLAQWGVHFDASADSTPKIEVITPLIGGAQPDTVVKNQPDAGDSAGKSLIVNFKYPVSKVGFVASNATTLAMKGYDPLGKTVFNTSWDDMDDKQFVGVSTTVAQGLSKIEIAYGGSAPEEIDDLIFEYVSRPVFRTYLAQIGDAKDLLQTVIVVSNLSNSTAQGEVRFFQSDSNPLSMPFNGSEASAVPLEIAPSASVTLTSPGTTEGTPKVGYATISSNVPVEGTAIFRVLPGGQLLSEVGLAAAPARYLVVGAVQKIAAGGLDSGVAIVNTSDEPANVTAMLVAEDGDVVAMNDTALALPAHNHKAKFMSELFPDFANQDFQGTLVVSSDKPVALVIVRALGGLPRSALPVGGLQR